jgi:hypothetical protein
LSQFKAEYAVATLAAGIDIVCLTRHIHQLDCGHPWDEGAQVKVGSALLGLAGGITTITADVITIVALLSRV